MSKGVRLYWFILQIAGIGAGIVAGSWLFHQMTTSGGSPG